MQDRRPPEARSLQDQPLAPESAELPSFEEALDQLESIVDLLEGGDLELEASLASFEQGVALARRCAGQIEDAERRIEVLVREGQRWVGQPFEASEADEGPSERSGEDKRPFERSEEDKR